MRAFSVLALILMAAAPLAANAHASNPCPDELSHTYGPSPPPGAPARSVTGPALVVVADTNPISFGCPGATFDGDYDAGQGGAFFGYGAWAEDPDCKYDLNVHGGVVTVGDLVFNTTFSVGEDDQGGPVKVPLVGGGFVCVTDGFITPATDLDDCLVGGYYAFGAGAGGETCGTGGGDGGYWVILDPGYFAGVITAS